MKKIHLNFVPSFCPACGELAAGSRAEVEREDFFKGDAIQCKCGATYQYGEQHGATEKIRVIHMTGT